ncbi:nuclear protein MDM1-like isoform X4 [Branchiostoma lanceolatum]|uniref:nuclear protein MDM1-like isoform X4 n=1 Tax=Branchiostoma lanceolatum TaxID=7740 RepID=UPI00345537C3
MPVRFKGHSEYDTNYKWLESRKSASHQPTREELAREAGLRSTDLGILQEPPLQSKKRVAPKTSGILHEPQMQAKKRVGTYAPTVPFALEWEDPLQPPDVVISKDPPVTEKVRESVEKMKTYKIEKKLREKEKRRREEKRRLEEKYDPPTPPAPRPEKSRERPREERAPERKPTKEKGQGDKASQKQGDKKEEKGGRKDEGKDEKKKRHRALEMKAGLKGERRKLPTMLSEYQRQFYEQQKLKDESPLMAADQMVYNSNPAMAPYRSDLIPRGTEYNRQFKVPKRVAVAESVSSDRSRGRRKKSKSSKKERRARSLSPDRLPPAGKPTEFMPVVWNDPRPIKNFGQKKSPHKLDNPHPGNWNWRSEYNSNYKSPTGFEYREGTWRGADPPHLQPRKEPVLDIPAQSDKKEWYNEVMELRKKADDYRRRSHGTHFSRDHLLQLMARQNEMWDQSESESTVSALSLASDPVDKGHARRHQRPSDPPKRSAPPAEKPRPGHRSASSPEEEKRPVQRKLAWDERGGGDRASRNRNIRDAGRRRRVWVEEDTDSDSEFGSESVTRNRDRRDVVGRRRVRLVEDTDSDSEPGSESVTSIGSIPSQGHGSHASASYSENTSSATLTEDVDDDGRLATPELKKVPAPVRRHHYDRTTPAIGGALLVKSPPPARKHTSPAKTQPAHRPKTAPAPQPSRPAGKTYHVADIYRSLSPTAGRPTPDPYPLREDEYAPGSPMEERYPPRIRTHPVSTSGQNGRPMTPPHLDDDRMSLISEQSASSLSIASSVLERAQKRRDQFWGKGEQGR